MSDTVEELLARGDVQASAPASPAAIQAVAERMNAVLPPALVELWSLSDGVGLDTLDAHLLGPTEILEILDTGWPENFVTGGYVPLLDDHESNYLMVLVHAPLAYRIAAVPHDDSPRLLFRNLDSCLRGLIALLDTEETSDSLIYNATGDYAPNAPRTPEDKSAAYTLLAAPAPTETWANPWNYAVQLVDADDIDAWKTLLETEHFIRRDVRAGLPKMTAPALQALYRQDEQAFDSFAAQIADAARERGLAVGAQKGHVLQVAGKGINLETFFYRRDIPDAIPRLITWLEDLIAGRNPHECPGHFMTD